MPDAPRPPREPWIDSAEADIARLVEAAGIKPESTDWPRCIGDAVERHLDAHASTQPPTVSAETAARLVRAVSDAREWVQAAINEALEAEDRLAARESLGQLESALLSARTDGFACDGGI